MLEVCCPERLEEAKAFAKTLGVEDNLQSRLDFLAAYACQDGDGHIDPTQTKCYLGADFAPHSFYFKMHRLLPDGTYNEVGESESVLTYPSSTAAILAIRSDLGLAVNKT